MVRPLPELDIVSTQGQKQASKTGQRLIYWTEGPYKKQYIDLYAKSWIEMAIPNFTTTYLCNKILNH